MKPIAKKRMLFIPLVLIIAAITAVVMIKTAPKHKQKPRQENAVYVRTMRVQPLSTQLCIRVTGTVRPARTVAVQSRVSGEVIFLSPNFEPGGTFAAGETLVRLDPSDYEIARAARSAELAKAELDYAAELGMQDIAQHEWDLIDSKEQASELEQRLMLRKPHLIRAESALHAAQAALRKAQLDVERTTIKAPFNAVVMQKNTELGAQVSAQSSLGLLAGADEYYVESTLPVNRLRHVQHPDSHGENGSHATVRHLAVPRNTDVWEGTLIRVKPDLEENGRLAQITVSVPEPAAAAGTPLLFGSYVEVDLHGTFLEKVYVIPREYVHDGGTVWIQTPEDRLHIQPVHTLWSDREVAVIDEGLAPGDRMVISDLPAPAEGLLLVDESASAKQREGE
ncbi:MAG: efflux RND transporter periplasmic adaptor subunit [Spartobacteria bacterium]|nr:efflux RND transporter periplasmic adaptor subunit [Spartobacteria bacterium]